MFKAGSIYLKFLEYFLYEWIGYCTRKELEGEELEEQEGEEEEQEQECKPCDMAAAASIMLSNVDENLREELISKFLQGELTLNDLAKYSNLNEEMINWLKAQVPFDKPFSPKDSDSLE